MVWSSKVTSVGFTLDALPAGFVSQLPPVTAHPEFKEEHVATSSAEAEIYSLALFTNEILSLSYAVEEAGFKFPKPAVVQVDNFDVQASPGPVNVLVPVVNSPVTHLLSRSTEA
jgi:hypothetical protein